MNPAAIALLAAAAHLLACAGLALCWRGGRHRGYLLERIRRPEDRQNQPLLTRLDARLRTTAFGQQLARRITGAGLHLTPATFCLLTLAAAAAAYLLLATLLAPFFGLPAVAVTAAAAYGLLERRRRQRTEQFVNQLPELARVLSNAVSAGLAMRTALAMAADEVADPAGEEIRQVCEGLRVGQAVPDALEQLRRRLPSREISVLVTTLVLATRAGGSLVTALQNISQTLETRKELRREIRTQLAQAVATTYMVPVMGLGSLLLINAIQPGSIRQMTASPLGQGILAVAAALYVLGTLVIRRITKIDS
ncbi:type II secretion system F family protein [Kitasatospora sp. NPDC059571]|uniref:type II secretion system F family protein n=1 Tax=Kitasatospora sp. NPDC059571 TaxID=3346871 RepID=UPI003682F9B2